jgi:hypothetical protein
MVVVILQATRYLTRRHPTLKWSPRFPYSRHFSSTSTAKIASNPLKKPRVSDEFVNEAADGEWLQDDATSTNNIPYTQPTSRFDWRSKASSRQNRPPSRSYVKRETPLVMSTKFWEPYYEECRSYENRYADVSFRPKLFL